MKKLVNLPYKSVYLNLRERHDYFYERIAGKGAFINILHFQYLSGRGIKKLIQAALDDLEVRHKVLDVGCGLKPFSRLRRDLEWIGIDVEPGPEVDLVVEQNEKWPIQSGSIDFVLCTSVLEHAKFPLHLMEEIERVCKPSAKILVTVPFLYPIHGAPDDFWRTTPEGLKLWMQNLSIIEVKEMGGLGTVLGTYINTFFRAQFYGKPILNSIRMFFLPINLILTFIINLVGLAVDKIDKTKLFPLGVYIVARK